MWGKGSPPVPCWPAVLVVVAAARAPAALAYEALTCPADMHSGEFYFLDAYQLAECRVLRRGREGARQIFPGPSPPSRALTAVVDKQLATFSDTEWARLFDRSWQSAPPPAAAAVAAGWHPLLLAAGADRDPADDRGKDYEFELGGYRVRASSLGSGALGDVWRARMASPAEGASTRPHVVLKRLRDAGLLIRRSGLREVYFGRVLAGEGGALLLDAFERRCLWSASALSPHRGARGMNGVTKSPDCTVSAPEDVASVMERARVRARPAVEAAQRGVDGADGVQAPVVSVMGHRPRGEEDAPAPLARPRESWLRRVLASITSALRGDREALAGRADASGGEEVAKSSLAFRLQACGAVASTGLGLPPPLPPLPASPPPQQERAHSRSVHRGPERVVPPAPGTKWLPNAKDGCQEEEEEEEVGESRELWLVMEDAGTSLRQLFTAVAPSGMTQPSPLSETAHREGWAGAAALTLARALFSALAACHARGVLHRDVKPANVLLAVEREEGEGGERRAVPSPTLAQWRAALTATRRGPYTLRLRLVDFGSAVDLGEPGWLYGEAGPSVAEATDDYVPPEVFAAPEADCPSYGSEQECQPPEPFDTRHPEAYDVWGAALTVLEAFLGRGLDVDARTLARLMRAMPASLRADPVAQRRWRVAMALAEMGVLSSPADAADAGAGGGDSAGSGRQAPEWALHRLFSALRRRDPRGRGIEHRGLLAALWGALQWSPAHRWSARRILRSLALRDGG